MPLTAFRTLLPRAHSQCGYLTTGDARELGIGQGALRSLAARGQVEHVARGLYRIPAVPSSPSDPYMEAALLVGDKAVISHQSALFLHAALPHPPQGVHLTVPPGYRTKRSLPEEYELHYQALTADQWTVVNGIPASTLLRALWGSVDILVDQAQVEEAIDRCSAKGLITGGERSQLMEFSLLRHSGAIEQGQLGI